MSSSAPMTPQSTTSSTKERDSTQPSSPAEPEKTPELEDLKQEKEDEAKNGRKQLEDEEDEEDDDMGVKAKALTNLLKTSSVFVAIMADKMKEQQKQQREQAKRQATKANNAEEKKGENQASARRSTRAQHGGDVQQKTNEEANPSKQLPTRSKGNKKAGAKKGITDYFKTQDIEIDNGPSVQEALAQAADEYEVKGEGFGAQELEATEQPELVTGGKMRSYQLEGLEWLKSLWMNGLCGILADEMGLGKTVQAISFLAFLREKNVSGPFLIAAPLSTLSNWVDEFARWTPAIKTILYHGSKQEREKMRRKHLKMQNQKDPDFPVICTSYEICMNDRKFLAGYQWRYIIVDEGHRLKNFNCKLIKELLTYNSANRLLITGTPLQNNIAELWSLLHFLLPEVFNDLDSFEGWFDFSEVLDEKGQKTMEKRKRNLVSTMHAILKPFLLRRIKTDVETSLPKKREYILYAPMTTEQQELYKEIVGGNSRAYLEGKAFERIEASKSRPSSLKRKAADNSGLSTPLKSLKSSRASTPGSATGSIRQGRSSGRKGRPAYADVSDREFNAKLRRLENGEESEADSANPSESEDSDSNHLASSIAAAKKEISSKKLQNPIMQARLTCNSPHNFYWPWPESDDPSKSTIDSTIVTASGKLLLLERLIPRLFSLNHKILIFSQFKTTLDIILAWASEYHDWPCCRIDGSISQADRQEQIRLFNDPESDFRLFLLSTRAGGQGINLTSADTVVLFDSDWNPQQDLQAMDRAHRIGQKKPVIVYRLATRGTVEEVLLSKAESKRKLEKLVIQKGKFKSLFEGIDSKSSTLTGVDNEEVKRILAGSIGSDDTEGYQRFDVGGGDAGNKGSSGNKVGGGSKEILSEDDLKILTDRSDDAYARAERGDEKVVGGGKGAVFEVKETKRDSSSGVGGGMLEGMDGKS